MGRSVAILIMLILSYRTIAQDQFMIRLNHGGIIQLMRSALKYNSKNEKASGFIIPGGFYRFKVLKKDLDSNPIIRILNQISDINLESDYPFYLQNSDISVDGSIDEESLTTTVTNSSSEGFDLKLTLDIKKLNLKTKKVILCENELKNKCGSGLQARFNDISLSLKDKSRIRMVAHIRVQRVPKKDESLRISLLSLESNLDSKNAPGINFNISEVEVPQIRIVIDGQVLDMDTSIIRDQIMEKQDFLIKKLLSFAGDFIAHDFTEMMNKIISRATIPTGLRVLDYTRDLGPEFFKSPFPDRNIFVADNLRTNDPLMPHTQRPHREEENKAELVMEDILSIIKTAQMDLQFKTLKTPRSNDLELRTEGKLSLNKNIWNIPLTIGNSSRRLPSIDLTKEMDLSHHTAVVVGEPVFNGVLDLLSRIGLFQTALENLSGTNGVYLDSLRLHLKNMKESKDDFDFSVKNINRIYVVANFRVNLKELKLDKFWWGKIAAKILYMIEKNKNPVLKFPIQVEIIPRVISVGKQVKLMLRVNSPFEDEETMRNDYAYPSNLDSSSSVIRKILMKILREGMRSYTDCEFTFPVEKYLKLKGMTVLPKDIQIIDSAYLMISGDFSEIDLKKINEKSVGVHK